MAVSVPSTAPELRAESAPRAAVFPFAGAALILSLVLVTAAQYAFAQPELRPRGWWLALATVCVAAIWQVRLAIVDWKQSDGQLWGLAPQWWRRILGATLTLAGLALWLDGTRVYYDHWHDGFDRGWLSWAAAAALTSFGLWVLQRPRRVARDRMSRWEWTVLLLALVIAATFRLVNYGDFPPETGISQIEELQAGQFGENFLAGDRTRWEFIGQAWLGALSIIFGGRTLWSVRIAYSIVAFLKIIPAYFWFRALAGPAGAMAGTALLAVSGWDTIVNRIPGQHDQLIVLICLALLAGPAVRGAWFVYPWVALLAGYTIYTYVAYRPLIFLSIIGAGIAALAQPAARGWRRWGRAAAASTLLLAIVAAMFLPLTKRLAGPGQFTHEYLNGWNRAHAIQPYYSPEDAWWSSVRKRWQRVQIAAALYYTVGDANPTHNVEGRPLIDAATGSLMLFGLSYCLLACLRGFYGIALVGFAVTFTGTLVATGNFDVLRCASTVPYVYTLAAVGAGALWTQTGRSFGRPGHLVAATLLIAGVLWSASWNAKLLSDLWSSPMTRQHYRSDLAYLLGWLRTNTSGRHVIGLIPYNAHVVMQQSDGAWLRGPDVRGEIVWDVHSTMDTLATRKGPVTLVLFTDFNSRLEDVTQIFREALPSVELRPGPKDASGNTPLMYAEVCAPAAAVREGPWNELQCRGVRARFEVLGPDDKVIDRYSGMVPFIDRHTFPGKVRQVVGRNEGRARGIRGEWMGSFRIDTPGTYVFFADAYDGSVDLTIDDRPYSSGNEHAIRLDVGTHTFRMTGQFQPRSVEPTARLWWKVPEPGAQLRPVPFYRMTDPDPECLARQRSGQVAEPAPVESVDPPA
jgi:hypothetical protein